MSAARRRPWDQMSDAEKHDAWCRMGPGSRAMAWDAMSGRDRRMIQAADARARVMAAGRVPEACGDAMPVAPARGAVVAFMPMATAVNGKGEEIAVPAGYRNRSAARLADAFDKMEARRPKAARAMPLFDATQVAVARDYAALFEKVDAGAVRGASLEAGVDGGGGDRDAFMQGRLDDRARLRAMQRRIGDGVALEVRRVRPSVRGSRRGIPDRRLVDMVCLECATIDDVLERFGWKKDCRVRNVLRDALAAALDRMAKRT